MTILNLFEATVSQHPQNVYLYDHDGNQYVGTTYQEAHSCTLSIAASLLALGIQKEDKLSIISEGRKEWVLCELGMYYVGAINVPLSIKLVEDNDLIFRLNHAEVKILFISQAQEERIRRIRSSLEYVNLVVLLDSAAQIYEGEMHYSQFIQRGEEYRLKHTTRVNNLINCCKEEDVANICYTSGTTANPKGILLMHRNYTANVEQALATIDGVDQTYKSLFILPLDHSFAHTVGIYILMSRGASMYFVQNGKTPAETLRNIPKNIQESQPTFILSVPALAKSFSNKIADGVKKQGLLVQKLFQCGMWASKKYLGNGFNKGKGMKWIYYPLFKGVDWLLFRKIRASFCNSLQFFVGGGALLDAELQYFFFAIGIPMYQGYGLTEAAPIISTNSPTCFKIGSSGAVARGIELKICKDSGSVCAQGEIGEIVIRGENVMRGYWKNAEATHDTLKNGWLHTGDMGYMDKDQFLYVLGRTKSLLISNDGEKYSPEGIEEALVESVSWIQQAVLYNNQNTYTLAIVVPSVIQIKEYMTKNALQVNDHQHLQQVLLELQKRVDAYKAQAVYNNTFPERWLPAALVIANAPFSETNGTVNSTLKIVRHKVVELHQESIRHAYTSQGKEVSNDRNVEHLKRLLTS